jgi:hypothetical protein
MLKNVEPRRKNENVNWDIDRHLSLHHIVTESSWKG